MKQQLVCTLFSLFLFLSSAFAQRQIKGKIIDSKGIPIESVTIIIKDKSRNTINFTRTNEKGEYAIAIKDPTTAFTIEATSIGYKNADIVITANQKEYNFTLGIEETKLKTVVVKNKPSLKVSGDTLNYKPSDFAGKQDRSIGDVLSKMPGMEVDDNGKIKYNGKAISNFYIDGDNLLDDKYNILSESVPYNIVDSLQVIQNDQPIKMLRKNNMSQNVAINLVLNGNARLKVMGEMTAGIGTPKKYDENVTAMLFKKDTKFINNLQANNVGRDIADDLTSFNFADYLQQLENNKPGNFLSIGGGGPQLPKSRYLFNNAGLINLNNLFKFGKDRLLRVNIAYLTDKQNQQYQNVSETYLPKDTIKYSELQHNIIRPKILQSKFTFNKNSDDSYLDNVLMANYTPTNTASDMIISGSLSSQFLKQQDFDLSNEFNYRKRLRSSNIINFYSYLESTSQPERLSVSPGLNDSIFNNGNPFLGLDQSVKLPTLFINNYVAMAFVKNKFTQTYKAGFSLQQQHLNTELFKTQNDSSTKIVSPLMTNYLNWFKTKFYINPIYQYNGTKLQATLDFPFSFNTINYKDASKTFNSDLKKFFVEPSLSIKYKTGIENFVLLNYSFKNNLGGIDNIFQGAILENYRSLVANGASLNHSQSNNVYAIFNLRNALKMFFFNATATYMNTLFNTLPSYELSNSISQRKVLPIPNHQKSYGADVNASKYIPAIRTTIGSGISFNKSQSVQLQNDVLLPFTGTSITFKTKINVKFGSFIAWSYGIKYAITNSIAETQNIKTTYKQLSQKSTLSFTTFKNVYVNLSGEQLFTYQKNQKNINYIFADLNMKYRWIKIKTDLELGVVNLANIKTFEGIYLSANSFSSGKYQIPGRVAMLKATFNF